MSRRRPDPPMTDKERILTHLVNGLASAQLLARGRRYYQEDFERRPGKPAEGYYVHVAFYREPVPGDLVLCQTSGTHPWTVAWFVEWQAKDRGLALLREIGSERLCNMGNESFKPIVGMQPLDLLEGEQRQFYHRVLRAFGRGNEYAYRFGGLDFPEKRLARIWIREVFGGHLHGSNQESVPFSVEIAFDRRAPGVKRILEAMRAAGYGTRAFDRRPVEPPPTEPQRVIAVEIHR